MRKRPPDELIRKGKRLRLVGGTDVRGRPPKRKRTDATDSANASSPRAGKGGIPKKTYTAEEFNRQRRINSVRDLDALGLSQSQIAEQTQLTIGQVKGMLTELFNEARDFPNRIRWA